MVTPGHSCQPGGLRWGHAGVDLVVHALPAPHPAGLRDLRGFAPRGAGGEQPARGRLRWRLVDHQVQFDHVDTLVGLAAASRPAARTAERVEIERLTARAERADELGKTPRQIAGQIGHEHPSMTLDVYMGRRVVMADAAEALALPPINDE